MTIISTRPGELHITGADSIWPVRSDTFDGFESSANRVVADSKSLMGVNIGSYTFPRPTYLEMSWSPDALCNARKSVANDLSLAMPDSGGRHKTYGGHSVIAPTDYRNEHNKTIAEVPWILDSD